jgi:hypothetical protein
MIEEGRPLCIMEYIHPRDILERLHDLFEDHGKWTLCEEPYSEVQWDWEACEARMSKTVDGQWYHLKFMEPAVYYVYISNGGMLSKNSFCEFHKPSVRYAV